MEEPSEEHSQRKRERERQRVQLEPSAQGRWPGVTPILRGDDREGLPRLLRQSLEDSGWTDVVLGCLVVDGEDAKRIIGSLMPQVVGAERDQLGRRLLAHALRQAEVGRRVVGRLVQAASQPSLTRPGPAISAGEIYGESWQVK